MQCVKGLVPFKVKQCHLYSTRIQLLFYEQNFLNLTFIRLQAAITFLRDSGRCSDC